MLCHGKCPGKLEECKECQVRSSCITAWRKNNSKKDRILNNAEFVELISHKVKTPKINTGIKIIHYMTYDKTKKPKYLCNCSKYFDVKNSTRNKKKITCYNCNKIINAKKYKNQQF